LARDIEGQARDTEGQARDIEVGGDYGFAGVIAAEMLKHVC
jgi:hypothetical protein